MPSRTRYWSSASTSLIGMRLRIRPVTSPPDALARPHRRRQRRRTGSSRATCCAPAGSRRSRPASGEEAIALAAEHRPDVSSWISGCPTWTAPTRRGSSRASRGRPGSPRRADVVGLSGGGEWVREAGFAGYLEKPISVREFADQVRAYCLGGRLVTSPAALSLPSTGSRSAARRIRRPAERSRPASAPGRGHRLAPDPRPGRVRLPSLDRADPRSPSARAPCSSSRSSFGGSTCSSGRRARSSPATASHSSCGCRARSTATGGALQGWWIFAARQRWRCCRST